MQLHTVIGLFGGACYLWAYALTQTNKLRMEDKRYAYLNIVGGVCSLYSLVYDFNLSSFVSQSLWLMFSLLGLHAGYRRKTLNAQNGSAT